MTDPTNEPDDLAELLAPQPGASRPGLREELLRRTERRLMWNRWVRRGTRAAAVAAVFVVGGLAGWFARTPVVSAPGLPEVQVLVVPVAVPVIVPAEVSTPEPAAPLSAASAELQAEQTDDLAEAAKLYRLAGDTFLRDEDYPNATRCYRLFLIRAGDNGLSPEVNDSWLLTSLKNAKFKENVDVPKIRD